MLRKVKAFRVGGNMTLMLDEIPVAIQTEPTPGGKPMRVLRLPAGTLGWTEDAFGFTSSQPPDWMRPLLDR